MKISGPKGPGTPPVVEAPGKEEPDRADRPSFQDALTGAQTAPPESDRASAVEAVVARLRAGEVTGAEAVEMLVDAVVREKIGEAVPAIKERMRAALRRFLSEDPVLAEKIRQLGPTGKGDEG